MSNNKKQQSKKQDEQISKPADAKPSKQTTLTMPTLQAQAKPKQTNDASRRSEKVMTSPSKVSPPPKTTEAESWQSPTPNKSPRDAINKHSPSKNTRG